MSEPSDMSLPLVAIPHGFPPQYLTGTNPTSRRVSESISALSATRASKRSSNHSLDVDISGWDYGKRSFTFQPLIFGCDFLVFTRALVSDVAVVWCLDLPSNEKSCIMYDWPSQKQVTLMSHVSCRKFVNQKVKLWYLRRVSLLPCEMQMDATIKTYRIPFYLAIF